MHIEPPHASLLQLHQLGLITAQELEDANAERDVAGYERLHPSEDNIDMPELAQDADLASTLGWLLLTDLLPKNDLDKRVATLPPRQQALAADGVRHYNRHEIIQASRLRHGHDRTPYQRPPAWKGALTVLGMILLMSVIYGVVTGSVRP